MTRDQAREFAKVVQAYADGAAVQWWDGFNWHEGNNDTFHVGLKWRVKPKEPRHLWTVVQDGKRTPTWTFFVEELARTQRDGLNETSMGEPYTIIHSIEVLP